jgi:hypothetical protein
MSWIGGGGGNKAKGEESSIFGVFDKEAKSNDEVVY